MGEMQLNRSAPGEEELSGSAWSMSPFGEGVCSGESAYEAAVSAKFCESHLFELNRSGLMVNHM